MSSSQQQSSRELIEKAERCEWSLECDEKLLELMQNVACVSSISQVYQLTILVGSRRLLATYRKLKTAVLIPKPVSIR